MEDDERLRCTQLDSGDLTAPPEKPAIAVAAGPIIVPFDDQRRQLESSLFETSECLLDLAPSFFVGASDLDRGVDVIQADGGIRTAPTRRKVRERSSWSTGSRTEPAWIPGLEGVR